MWVTISFIIWFLIPVFLLWRISDNMSCIAQCMNDMNKRDHKRMQDENTRN